MSVNHRIEYIPLTKDLNGNHLIYPIYIPINIDEPEIFAATGKLSPHDYKRTLKLLHSRPMFKVDDKGAGQVEEAGFPFAPLIAALAPIVIPGVIKAAKNIFGHKSDSSKGSSKGSPLGSPKGSPLGSSKGRLYMGRGSNSEDGQSEDADISNDGQSEDADKSGYIPTNPNINSIKKLQSLYDTYK